MILFGLLLAWGVACVLLLLCVAVSLLMERRPTPWKTLVRLRDAQLDRYMALDSPLQQTRCYGCGSYDRPVFSYRFADGVATTVAALCSSCARKRHAILIQEKNR